MRSYQTHSLGTRIKRCILTNVIVAKLEQGMYPLKTNKGRDVRKLKCQYKVRNMPPKKVASRS